MYSVFQSFAGILPFSNSRVSGITKLPAASLYRTQIYADDLQGKAPQHIVLHCY